MRRGQPINPKAMMDAQQQLQSFQQNAEQTMQGMMQQAMDQAQQSGQPADPQAIQQFVMQQMQQQFQQLQQAVQDAPWQPLPFENKQQHLESHTDLMKTVEFEGYPPEIQALFYQHLQLTQQALQAEQQGDPALLPKTSITAKATVSAKVMAKILNAQGIQTDENEVAEPPLETAVLDFVDKPDAEDTGNSHMDDTMKQLEMMQAQDAHELNQAKVAQLMSQAQNNQELADAKQLQGMGLVEEQQQAAGIKDAQSVSHAQELHDQTMAHREQAHQAKLKQQAQAAKAKPKPASK